MFNNNRKSEGALASVAGAEVEKATFGSPRNAHASVYKGDPAAHSIVDEYLTMKGDLESDGDIHVKGKVLGNIRCKLLIIEIDAMVEGGVEADEVIVRGNTRGKIQADRVRLEKTANVDSEICHRSFSAEEGARIKGSLRAREEAAGGLAKDAGAKDTVIKDGARTKLVTRAKDEALGGEAEAVS